MPDDEQWPEWRRADHFQLAAYVTPEAGRALPIEGINAYDAASRPGGRRAVAQAIYDTLAERNIRYALEEYHPSEALQIIRTPAQILEAPRQGTCLDLAILFCGLCLTYELLPLLIVAEGHALAAVSLTHGFRHWEAYDRPGRDLFDKPVPMEDSHALEELIDEGSYMAVECTGFARSELLSQRAAGGLTFAQAVDAGRRQLGRSGRQFQFAVDIAVARYRWRIEPYGGPRRAARPTGLIPVAEVTALPTDSTAFTGRKSELKQVIEKLPGTANGSAAGVHVIDGMPGVGKTAFAVHLAHRLAGRFPDKQVFLRLNGHTPGHSPVDPGDALGALLLTTGVDLEEIPAGTQARASMWRERVADKRVLLLLDDAVSTSQVRPLLPGHAGALVLITSRHRLSALSEATPIALEPMRPDEAAELFVQIAARPGVLPADAQVAELVRLCGCLPLALTLTAGQLKNHPAWTCGDQVDDLREATDRTSAIHAENITVTAAFEASYRQLAPGQKRFFRQLGLHPGTSIDAYAAAALAGTDMAAARLYLDALFSYHLIDEPARGRYRLHDLIRDYARVLATGDPQAEQGEAMDRLLGYYLRTAQAADRHLTRKTTPVAAPCVIPIPAIPGPVLGTRQEAVAWMTTEGLNLSATAEYAANNDRTGFTVAVAAAMHGFLRSRGSWEDQALSLQRTALDAARRTGDPAAEATALGDLGDIQALRGDFGAAAVSLARATDLYRGLGDQAGEADVLANLGAVQRVRGDFPAAATTFAQALQLYLGLGNQAGEAKALTGLGVTQLQAGEYGPAIASLAGALRLQRARGDRSGEAAILNRLGAAHYVSGDYPAAATQLTQALEMYRDLGERLGQAEVLNNLGVTQYLAGKFSAATVSLTGALELFQDLGYHLGEANALKDLGVLQYTKGEYPAAGISLTRALNLYMELDNRLGQANALDRIGVLERMTGNYPVASNSHEKALKLHQGLGHRTGEAETLNNMGDLSLAAGSSAEACAHYMKAHAIAVMITSALEEARALEGIGQCQIRDGRFHEGFITIRQALAIYRRLGSPNAQYSEKLLHDHAGQAEVRHEVDAESASRGAS